MSYSVSYVYDLVDRYSAKIKRITASTQKFQTQIRKTGVTLKKFGSKVSGVGRKMSSFLATAGAGMALLFPIKAAISFESAMVDVRKSVDGLEDSTALNKMKDLIFKLSAELSKPPVFVAALAAAGGKLGVSLGDMERFLKLAGSAAVALDMSGQEAGRTIGRIKSRANFSLDAVKEVLDAVAFLEVNTSASGKEIVETIERFSVKIKELNFPPGLAAGWAALAVSMAPSPQVAARSLKSIIGLLQKSSPEMAKAIDLDPSKALLLYFKKLAVLPVKEMREKMKIFGTGEQADLALSFVKSTKELDRVLNLVSDTSKFAGSMQAELAIKLNSTAGVLGKLYAILSHVSIRIGEALTPAIKELAKWLSPIIDDLVEWIKNNQTATKWIMIIVGALAILGPAIIIIGLLISSIGIILNVAFAPWFLIAVAIIAVIAGLIYVFMNFGKVVDFLKKKFIELWNWCKPLAIIVAVIFGPAIVTVLALVAAVKGLIWAYKKLASIRKKMAETKAMTAEEADFVMSDEIYSKKDINHAHTVQSKPVTINGQINVGVDGGKVKSSSLDTDTGGNLGFNNPAYNIMGM